MKKRMLALALAALMLGAMLLPTSAAEPIYAVGVEMNMIIEPQYDDAGNMAEEGYAAVKLGDSWGVIDTLGNLVVEAKYAAISAINGGRALAHKAIPESRRYDEYAKKDLYNYDQVIIDMQGNEILITGDDTENMYGMDGILDEVVNRDGIISGIPAMSMSGSTMRAVDGSSLYAAIKASLDAKGVGYREGPNSSTLEMIGKPNKGNFGARLVFPWGTAAPTCFQMDAAGNVLRVFPEAKEAVYEYTGSATTEGEYILVEPAKSGVFSACADEDGLTLVECGVIEANNVITALGVMDENDNLVIEAKYKTAKNRKGQHFFSDVITLQDETGKWGGINRAGVTVVPFEYDELGIFSAGYANAEKNGEVFYVDTANNRYDVACLDGATLKQADPFGLNGVATVTDSNGLSYCIAAQPVGGVLPVVRGSVIGAKLVANEQFVRVERDGKVGFAQVGAPKPASGTPIGDVEYTNIVAYIDGKPIRSYNINNNTHIVIEDLIFYGFEFIWDGTGSGRAMITKNRTFGPDFYIPQYEYDPNAPTTGVAMQHLATDVTTWLGDTRVKGYNIGGQTCIWLDDLARVFDYGIVWDGASAALRLTTTP